MIRKDPDRSADEPRISVGILSAKAIEVTLEGEFTTAAGVLLKAGRYLAGTHGKAVVLGAGEPVASPEGISLSPCTPSSAFVLHGVTIGVQFHWQREQDERFKGSLRLLNIDGTLTAINEIPLEEYLKSVISSEMNAESSPEFLRAHAVTSRSWLLAQLRNPAARKPAGGPGGSSLSEDGRHLRWYDREDHPHFDVCADDHCQRYQGITSAYAPRVEEAVQATRGIVLTSGGEICDARFSKSCGGISEAFENVWAPVRHAYLRPVLDRMDTADAVPDLVQEAAAEAWIRSEPPSFCNTKDQDVLSQVLVRYDRETPDFFRWKVGYTQAELAEIVRQKTGIDFGRIRDLVPLERGASGRLIRLQIIGTEKNHVVGKELEIRRTLSKTHLYSAAFVVDPLDRLEGIPQRFLLTGAGWGHGVGLCQIGAAVMGARGYSHEEILKHYFTGAEITPWYR